VFDARLMRLIKPVIHSFIHSFKFHKVRCYRSTADHFYHALYF